MRAFFSAFAAAYACDCFLASSASASAICCLTSFAEGTNASGLFVMLYSMSRQIEKCASYPFEGGDLSSNFLCIGFGSGFCDPEPGHIQRGQEDQGQHGCYGEPADNRKRHRTPEYGRSNRDHAERRG